MMLRPGLPALWSEKSAKGGKENAIGAVRLAGQPLKDEHGAEIRERVVQSPRRVVLIDTR